MHQTKRFIRMPEVISTVGLSRSEIYRRMESGDFPQSVSLGARAVAWTEESVQEWMNQIIRVSESEGVN